MRNLLRLISGKQSRGNFVYYALYACSATDILSGRASNVEIGLQYIILIMHQVYTLAGEAAHFMCVVRNSLKYKRTCTWDNGASVS